MYPWLVQFVHFIKPLVSLKKMGMIISYSTKYIRSCVGGVDLRISQMNVLNTWVENWGLVPYSIGCREGWYLWPNLELALSYGFWKKPDLRAEATRALFYRTTAWTSILLIVRAFVSACYLQCESLWTWILESISLWIHLSVLRLPSACIDNKLMRLQSSEQFSVDFFSFHTEVKKNRQFIKGLHPTWIFSL